jgi:hypothetical protein
MSWNQIGDELHFQQNRSTFKIALFDQLIEQLLTTYIILATAGEFSVGLLLMF